MVIIFLSILPNFLLADISVAPNKHTAYYLAGEAMEFIVQSDDDDPIEWFITYGEFADTLLTGTITDHTPGEVSKINFTLNHPGFVYCVVNQDADQDLTAVTFSPNDIEPILPVPSDFQSFWQSQIQLSNAIPLDPELTFEEEDDYTISYRISLANIDDRRVYGFISIPKSPGPHPASITLPPFGSGGDVVQNDNFTAERAGMISAAITIHDAPPGEDDPNAYSPDNRTDREELYYRFAIIGAIRLIDYIYTRDDFDQQNVCLIGTSQGAGLSLLVGGIDDRVNLMLQSIAALCSHAGFLEGQASGFPYYLNLSHITNGTAAHLQATAEATSYYDGVNSAAFFNGPSYNFISYQDLTCPPATGYMAFNQLPGPKIMVHSFTEGHSNPSEFTNARYDFFRRHYEATRTPPWPYADDTQGYYIDAGENFEAVVNTPEILNGSYDKNGQTDSSFEIEWKVMEGPSGVLFSDPNALNSEVTFTQTGDYKLRLLITDPYAEDDEIFYQLVDYVYVSTIADQSSSTYDASALEHNIELFPNPSIDFINIKYDLGKSSGYMLSVIDASGKIALRETGKGQHLDQAISLQHLPSGKYHLEIITGRKRAVEEFIILPKH